MFQLGKDLEQTADMPDSQLRLLLMKHSVQKEDLLNHVCSLGISGAKIRNVSSEEIDGFKRELAEAEQQLREHCAKNRITETAFFVSQLALLERKIVRFVDNMLSPQPLYEFYRKEAEALVSEAPFERIEKVLSRFHLVADQLRKRRKGKTSYLVEDEYDVQDLLRALLKLDFDDVLAEEWTPSYAGAGSKIDFVLRREGILVEVKYGPNLTEKQIGEQLIVDIAKYEEYPNVNVVVCFVYDPDRVIGNPRGIESDLEKLPTRKLKVRAFVRPKT
jgi:hypothetical protein